MANSVSEVEALEALRMLIRYIGDNPDREGVRETPSRIISAYQEIFGGYNSKPVDVIKTFAADGYDELIFLRDIELFSTCEHHMLPFFGKAHVAYIPGDTLIGASKLARIVEIYGRRLQIQERLTNQITTCLMDMLKPKGAACIIEAEHLCIKMRGVIKQNSVLVTSSLKGVFLTDQKARSEVLQFLTGK